MKLRITVEGKIYEVDVEIVGEPENAASIPAFAASPPPAPATPPAAAPIAPSATVSGGKVFPSPLAGTVRAIRVRPGDSVTTDQEFMVLEAMKMETSISAVSAGTVKAVLVNVGDAVKSGQPLIEFE